jgi:hypothetical protein
MFRWNISLPSSGRQESYILRLFTHLQLGLSSGLFPTGFPTTKLYTFIFSPIRATCPAYLILLDLIILIIQITQFLVMQFSPTLPLLHPSLVQVFSSAPCSQTPSVYVRFEVFTAVTTKNGCLLGCYAVWLL